MYEPCLDPNCKTKRIILLFIIVNSVRCHNGLVVFSKYLLVRLESHTELLVGDWIVSFVHGSALPSCRFVFLGSTSLGVNMGILGLLKCASATLWTVWERILIQRGFFFLSFFFWSPSRYYQVISVYFYIGLRKLSPIADQRSNGH